MTTLVYQYGLHAPHEQSALVAEQLRLSSRYRNVLVEIERERRAEVRAFELALGDLPAAMRVLAEAQQAAEVAAAAVSRHRAKTRKRDEPPDLKASLREARADRNLASREVSAMRRVIRDDPAVVAGRDAAYERSRERAKSAYAQSGLYWGQRALVDEAAGDSFLSLPLYARDWQPNDPRFTRHDGGGSVGLQIMGGLSVDELVGCADTRVRLQPPDPQAWSGRRSDRRRYGSTAELSLRIGTDEHRCPIWAKWVCDMDRPLPQDARVVWATVRRTMVGPHSRWHLQLTLSLPSGRAWAREGARSARLGGAVAVDVGWRVCAEELRVVGWHDEHGGCGELRLSAADLAALRLPDEIRSERDLSFDAAKGALSHALRWAYVGYNLADKAPWLAERTRSLSQWRSPARLAALCMDWPHEDQDPVLAAAYRALCVWYYRDRHDWESETAARARALRRRREIYRCFAARLAQDYDTIVVEQFDRRDLIRRPVVGSAQDTSQNKTARSNRVLAATSELMSCGPQARAGAGAIASAARSRARTLVAMPAADTTRECPSCGRVADRHAEESIVLVCGCGHHWDQDVTGAPKVLLARYRESPRNGKILGSARDVVNIGDSAEIEETRWQRVARLRREKQTRMMPTRVVEPNGAV